MKFQKYWWLGFLGFVGLYKLPTVIGVFNGTEAAWRIIEMLWLLWFSYFFPSMKEE